MGLRENLWRDEVTRAALSPPLCVSPDGSIRETVQAMQQASVGYALVCEDDVLRGIFTERDLLKRVIAPGTAMDAPLRSVMTPNPVTLKRTDSIGWAIRTMYQGHYRHLPVVDAEIRPVGVLSVGGIVQYLVDHVPLAVYNLPPVPGQAQETREGA